MASPTSMTVSMCMTCEPMETAVVAATPSYWPTMNRSAMPVERLQEIGKQIGQGEADNVAENTAGGQILFHGNSSFSRPPASRRGLWIFAARPDIFILHPAARFVSSFFAAPENSGRSALYILPVQKFTRRAKIFLAFFRGIWYTRPKKLECLNQ